MHISSGEFASPVPVRRPAELSISEVTAGYGGVPVISDVSLDAAKGEIVAVLGPNGAGKSTLLKALMGVIPISSGSVLLAGRDVTSFATDRLARLGVGYVPQTRDVFDKLRVRENLEMGGYLLDSHTVRERIDEVVALFPALSRLLDRPAGNLSGGERKMLGIARVLMVRPTVLILDEPTAGLSPELSKLLLEEYIRRLASDGRAVVLVEQKAMAALEIADWAHVMVSGRTRLTGPAARMLVDDEFGEAFLGAGLADHDGVDGQEVTL